MAGQQKEGLHPFCAWKVAWPDRRTEKAVPGSKFQAAGWMETVLRFDFRIKSL
jgi:hypothetical protein